MKQNNATLTANPHIKKNQTSGAKSSAALVLQKNKKAYFEYNILNTYRCGIVLEGYEVKSIRAKQFNFVDSFARVAKNTLLLHNFFISPYKFHTHNEIDPIRVRTLLAHKKEILKIKMACKKKGHTLIPLEIILTRGFIKIVLGLGLGKKLYDKKQNIKKRMLNIEAERDIKRAFEK